MSISVQISIYLFFWRTLFDTYAAYDAYGTKEERRRVSTKVPRHVKLLAQPIDEENV